MTAGEATAGAPGLLRRLACLLYEGVLLFGVVMAAGLLYGIVTQQRHALVGTLGLQTFLFAVLGLYFVGFWSRQGQTLAMRTWRMRVVAADGRPPGPLRATARYLTSWLWFAPALAGLHFSGLRSAGAVSAVLVAGALAYALVGRLHPRRQLPHDLICGTRVIDWQPAATPRAAPAS